MSSILDALERVERERQRDSSILKGDATGHPRHVWSLRNIGIIVGMILLINLITWLVVWRINSPTDSADKRLVAQGSKIQSSSMSTAPPPTMPQRSESQSSITGPEFSNIEEELKRRARPGTRPLLAEAGASPPPLSTQTSHTFAVNKARSKPGTPESQTADTGSITSPLAALTQQVVRSPAPVKAQPDAEDIRDSTETMVPPPPATTKTLTELETSEWERLQSMWDVPQDVRIELVKLKITVHVYNEDPRKRFVVVNRHRYGEGDSLETEGLILKRIVRDGIIIDYGEGLVKL